MTRRMLLVAACLAVGFGVAMLVPDKGNSAGLKRSGPLSKTDKLREQLWSLRPRSPQEFEFVDRIVQLVEQGKLPIQTVEAAFNWARKKHKRYQFPYYQRAQMILAARSGIRIAT